MSSTMLFIGGLGGWEIFLIIFAILVLFGAKKIPELARGLGQGIREFKDATKEVKSNLDQGMNQPPVNTPQAHTPPAPPRPADTPNPNTTSNPNPPIS